MHTHTLALNQGGTCWSHPISKFAQCIRKPQLIHISNLSIALSFIVRHLFCYSHRGDKRQQSHASSCSPPLLRLCAGSCFADQWMGSSAGHKAPQMGKKREKTERNRDYLLQVTFLKETERENGRGREEKKTKG